MNRVVKRGESFAQVQFANGERVLISVSQHGLRISKLLFGIFPIKTVFERSRTQSVELERALLHIMDWDGNAVLEKLLNRVLACENIAEVERRFRSV